MAQTGFTPISNYYSATATNVPTAGNLVAGELAINTADGKLFYKDSSGVVQTIATKATAALPTTTTGSGNVVLSTSPTLVTPALGTPSALVLTNASGLPSSALPTGTVLQVVNATYSTSVTNATSTYADTGLSASITPKFSTSKILIIIAQQGVLKTASDTKIQIKLFRGGTDLTVLAGSGATNNTSTILIGSVSIVYLDSPATTSSTTYKTQFNSSSNTSYVGVQDSSLPSTITLLEIAA